MSQYERLEQSRRKHEPSNSGASRAPPPPPKQRPDWKGPGFSRKVVKSNTPRAPAQASLPNVQPQLLPVELQQLVLNIFRTTFPISQDPDGLKPLLQNIKDALFKRDFELAFENEERCEAYAVRWSPSRMLGYSNLLAWVVEECKDEKWVRMFLDKNSDGTIERKPSNVLCIGGGAAEMAAFSSLVRHLHPRSRGKPAGELAEGVKQPDSLESDDGKAILKLHLVDAAPWSNVISKIESGLTTPPTLSKYASASARANNASFIQPGATNIEFTQADILGFDKKKLEGLLGSEPALVTMFFTLNELYATNLAKTTKLLMELSLACKEGTLLCVIDSAGSYSEIAIPKLVERRDSSSTISERDAIPSSEIEDPSSTVSGSQPKTVTFAKEKEVPTKYPMHWLMDRTLLGKETGKVALWKKLVVDESRWFRLDDSLKYPISIENMRFQVHMFKRL